MLPEKASEVMVLGPFFDREGAFLKQLHAALAPKRVTVGLQPDAENSSLCKLDALPEVIRFHDVSDIGVLKKDSETRGYFHAKALYVTGADGEAVLITGSANPSHPAWSAGPARRNAEAVVLQQGEAARTRAEELGLLRLPGMPAVNDTALRLLQEKAMATHASETASKASHTLVGEVTEAGVWLACPNCAGKSVTDCRVEFEGQNAIEAAVEHREDGLLVKITENLDAVMRIMLHLDDDSQITAYVHNVNSVKKLATTSKQQSFRDALDSLGGDSPDFANLLRIADKLIFDDDNTQRAAAKKIAAARTTKADADKEEKELGPLSVSASDTKQKQRRTRELYHGDLAFVIDTLIHHLGIGLHEAAEKLDSHAPSEEEMVGKEDGEQEELAETIKPFDLLKTCNSKVRTLVNRMCKQFEKATSEIADAHKVVDQVLGVLAVLREVRANDARLSHLTHGESLVPMDARQKLLDITMMTLFGKGKALYDQMLDHYHDDPDNDLPRLLGLIIWLAWDCGLNISMADNIPKHSSDSQSIYMEMANLLEIALRAEKQDEAIHEAWHSAARTSSENVQASATKWLRQFQNWAADLEALKRAPVSEMQSQKPRPGHLAIAITEKSPKVRMVVSVPDDNVYLAEVGEDGKRAHKTKGIIKFPCANVVAVARPTARI